MFVQVPYAEEIQIKQMNVSPIAERLKKWDPEIDPSKVKILQMQHKTWNDGSLGCPMPGKCYTQALVPGFLIFLEYGNLMIEVHTDSAMRTFAMPGVGFI